MFNKVNWGRERGGGRLDQTKKEKFEFETKIELQT